MIEVILSVGLAFLATVIAEPHFIQYMKMKQLGQTTLDEGPSWHKAKSGTPTMGGLVFLCMISISSFNCRSRIWTLQFRLIKWRYWFRLLRNNWVLRRLY